MGVVNTTYTFQPTDVITSSRMNDIIDQTTMTGTAISGATLEVTTSGQLKVRAQNITSNELATDAVTSTKIANGAVTSGKLSTGGPTWTTSSVTIPNVVWLANDGFRFASDGAVDTGISWQSDGVMNVLCNGVVVGQFNSSGWTGGASYASNGVAAWMSSRTQRTTNGSYSPNGARGVWSYARNSVGNYSLNCAAITDTSCVHVTGGGTNAMIIETINHAAGTVQILCRDSSNTLRDPTFIFASVLNS